MTHFIAPEDKRGRASPFGACCFGGGQSQPFWGTRHKELGYFKMGSPETRGRRRQPPPRVWLCAAAALGRRGGKPNPQGFWGVIPLPQPGDDPRPPGKIQTTASKAQVSNKRFTN